MISLPIEKKWFRLLFLYSFVIGILGGVSALAYTLITNAPINWLFGESVSGYWVGSWWWILLTAIGGGLVTFLRARWGIPEKLPSAIELGKEAILVPKDVPKLVTISVISLVFGASLGPSYGIVLLGGGIGSWLYHKLKIGQKNKEIEREYTRTGMSGSLGSVFSDPLLGTLFTMELSPSKLDQLASSIPRLIAATFGFLVFFGVTGSALQDSYLLPDYEFKNVYVLAGIALGIFAVVTLLIMQAINKIAEKTLGIFKNQIVRGVIGGGVVGLVAFAAPLTIGSGNPQLSYMTQDYAVFGTLFLAIVVLLKMFAVSVSQQSGFLGGNVFPTLFIGGVTGLLVHAVFPDLPVALCVSAMMAAVPGATLSTPLSIALIAALGVGIGSSQITPVIVAVIAAQICLVSMRYLKQRRQLASV